METIIVTILTGLFSLAGIWYQNYLNKKSNRISQPSVQDQTNISRNENLVIPIRKAIGWKRISFTLLIVILPYISFDFIYRLVGTYERRENLTSARNIIVSIFLIWLVITVIALFSGWKAKTAFEKIILIVSSIFLCYLIYSRYITYTNDMIKN